MKWSNSINLETVVNSVIKCLIQYFDLRILRFHLSIFLLSLCVAWDNFPATSGIESFQVQRRAPQDGDGWM